MEAYVKSDIQNGIGTIEFFHPQSNSMPGSQLRNLATEIEKLGNDDEVKVIVLKSGLNILFKPKLKSPKTLIRLENCQVVPN